MPYPFVFWQQPNPFTAPHWGSSSDNRYPYIAPQAGHQWGGWRPFPSPNGPYPQGTSPWTAPPPLQPSPFPQNTPFPHPNVQQYRPQAHFPSPPSYPSPQGVVGYYQPSPQYISPALPHSQVVLPSASAAFSNNNALNGYQPPVTSRAHTPIIAPPSFYNQHRNRPPLLRRPRSLAPCFRYSSLRSDAGYNNVVPTIIYYHTSRGTTIETRGTSERFLPLFCYFLYYLNAANTDKRSRKVITFHSTIGKFKYVSVKDVWDALRIYAPHVLRGAQCPAQVKWEHLRPILRSVIRDAFRDW